MTGDDMPDTYIFATDSTSATRSTRNGPARSSAALAGRPGAPFAACAGLVLAVTPFVAAEAAGEISSLDITERPGTPFRYSADGTEYTWGIGRNRLLDGFTSDDREYGFAVSADRVDVRRDSAADADRRDFCNLFAERGGDRDGLLSPDYPVDCDLAGMLRDRAINRGALDLFANEGTDTNDVERVDYLFDSGILAPVTPEGLRRAGHVVAEKGGDDRLKIAAVLSLDVLGQPASYGPPVLVRAVGCMDPAFCYGLGDEMHDYAFFADDASGAVEVPADGRTSVESVAAAFVSSERLGLEAGQRYFGFSLFADDVDTDDHDVSDPDTYPADTGASAGVADLHGGLSGYYIDEALSNGTGRAFLDENGNGLPDEDEAGIADIQIQLYRDTDGDGVFDPRRDAPVCNATDTDRSGLFVLPGLPDGDYFAVLRENDPELPAGLSLAEGTNPRPFSVAGGDVDDLNFSFTGDGVGTGGVDDGGADTAGAADGGADGGVVDAGGEGGDDAADGGADDGAADAGGEDAGGADTAGAADEGAADAGGDDAGGADTGDGDDGAVDDGAADAGGTATAGAADAGGGDTGGAADGGTDDAGAGTAGVDDGGADAGSADAGSTDAGATDAGVTDAGATDAGATDAGATDAGATDAGATDAGGADTGVTDAGATDAGAADAGATDAGATDAGGGDTGATDGGGSEPDSGASRDDIQTSTTQDMFDVLQDQFADVDVLSNDVDGSDGGLTIIRVLEPPNGMAEIVELDDGSQVIRYTPDDGFFGTDAFIYEIRDGDGVEQSGTATANVIRYTDINRNGINDFVECECTDLTLETGVNGSGIGRLSLGALALLAAAGVLRAIRRRRGLVVEGVR